ncbi:DUF1878 family protein [Pontibacillus litoralis]|uniref:Uncharacterized protein n=1 Tax=Pontibacillus litoralis JSM 072002 TaxID=1385512 RepID=A0A0A5HNQ7_9BACI|nr:DUF1878 family protein [Pontibacillus litoralis]KGX85272.1 hypothetical protein N784_09535 [Pontibacillus litoralis JSM 072002]
MGALQQFKGENISVELHEDKTGKLALRIRLLSQMIDGEKHPFKKMVVEKELTEAEYAELLALLDDLEGQYEEQKEAGLLDFTALLLHFAGMLNVKLHPDYTIKALKQEGLYLELMKEFSAVRWKIDVSEC